MKILPKQTKKQTKSQKRFVRRIQKSRKNTVSQSLNHNEYGVRQITPPENHALNCAECFVSEYYQQHMTPYECQSLELTKHLNPKGSCISVWGHSSTQPEYRGSGFLPVLLLVAFAALCFASISALWFALLTWICL